MQFVQLVFENKQVSIITFRKHLWEKMAMKFIYKTLYIAITETHIYKKKTPLDKTPPTKLMRIMYKPTVIILFLNWTKKISI